MINKIYECTDEQFVNLIKNSANIAEVLFKLGYTVKGNSWGYSQIKQRMVDLNLSSANFKGKNAYYETNKEREKSCGCIIINKNKVLLIKQTKGHWGFPKGHIEKDETEIETAIREVKEETNLDVEIDANKRYTMEYVTDKGTLKQVVLFIAKCTGGEIKAQECEVNDIKWLDFDEAMQTITYDNTRELFKKILKERKI